MKDLTRLQECFIQSDAALSKPWKWWPQEWHWTHCRQFNFNMVCCYTARTFFPYKGSGSSRPVLSWGTCDWGVWVGLVRPSQAALSTGEMGHSRLADSTMLSFERQKTGTYFQLLVENLPVLSKAALLTASHPYSYILEHKERTQQREAARKERRQRAAALPDCKCSPTITNAALSELVVLKQHCKPQFLAS